MLEHKYFIVFIKKGIPNYMNLLLSLYSSLNCVFIYDVKFIAGMFCLQFCLYVKLMCIL